VADFVYQQAPAALDVAFQDSSTGAPSTWWWNFGDGTPAVFEAAPVHTYSTPGTYLVGLTVGDGAVTTSSVLHSVTVVDPGGPTPTPTAIPTPTPTPDPTPPPTPTPDPTATATPTPDPTATATPTPTATNAPGPDPVNCTGYAEPRVMLETQDWWTQPDAPIEGGSEHIHLATCFPLDQTIKGVIPFDIHVQLHLTPGVLTKVDVSVFGNSLDVNQIVALPNYTCPTSQCDLWYHVDYDTTKVPVDGYLEFRFHAKVIAPDGSEGYTSTGWQATLANGGGRPVRNYRTPPFIEARGWYTGTEYENARLTTNLPTGPVSGIWTCTVKLAKGSGGTNATRVFVSLDPRFHANPVDHGQVILDQTAAYQGAISIDTRTLPDGVHRLFMRTDSRVPSGTGSGVLVVQFRVDNGGVLAAAVRIGNQILDPTGPVLPTIALLFVFLINLPWSAIRRRPPRRRSEAEADQARQLSASNR
jgi:PKD repeat protein